MHPTDCGMVSPSTIIERMSSLLIFRPCCSWIRASYSMGRLKFLERLHPFQHTFCICLETWMKFASPHPSSSNTYTCGCPLSPRNASMSSTCGHHSRLNQTLSFFYFPSSSLQHFLPKVRGILGPPCTVPRSTSTLKSKAPVSFPFQFCRLESSCLFTNLDMVYTQQLSCLLVHVLGMHTLLASMAAER